MTQNLHKNYSIFSVKLYPIVWYEYLSCMYRVCIVYLSYMYRVCFEIYSGLDAAKVLLISGICKRNR